MTVRTGDPATPERMLAQWVALPAGPAAAGIARRFLAEALCVEQAEVLEVVVLLTSELVTNAVLHGLGPISLQLRHPPGTLRVEVHDGGRPFSSPAAGGSRTDGGGRGLLLVAAMATSWGSQSNGATLTGKTLWFEVADHQPGPAVDA